MAKRISTLDRPVIGWREWVALPDLGIPMIKAKVDTGARSSAIHVSELTTFHRRGVEMVRFVVQPAQRNPKPAVVAEARLLEWRRVRSSGGHASRRPVVRTTLELLGKRWKIELTLASRDAMGFRMLLGREAVRGRAVVDPGASFYGAKPPVARPRRPRRRRQEPLR
jgi:hypothetical protein